MDLFAWGANSHGQLGVGTFSEYELIKKVDSCSKEVSSVSGGGGHTILLDGDGCLLATGWNNKGQLGNGSTGDLATFVKLNLNLKFQKISCGWDTSAGITTDNRLFVWGSNSYNQLGFSSKDQKMILNPLELKLPLNESVRDILFGLRHSAILTKSNKIFICGSLKHFKDTKHKTIQHNSIEFIIIAPETQILQIACGQNHIVLLDSQNSICGIGENKYQQCSRVQPKDKVVKLLSGWTHVGFLTESRELFLFGRNNYGQLGNGTRIGTKIPQKFPIHPIDDFDIGAEHGIAISNGDVYTWGWNEHGNCGNGSFDDLLSPDMIKVHHSKNEGRIFAGSGFCLTFSSAHRES